MAHRIDIRYKIKDTRAEVKRKHFESLGLKGKIQNVELVNSYLVNARLTSQELKTAAETLTNPLLETSSVDKALSPKKFTWAVEIGFLPGVTDNVGTTARESIEDRLDRKFSEGEAVYTTQVFFLKGNLAKADVTQIADSLHNSLIQRAWIKNAHEFNKDGGMGKDAPKVTLRTKPEVLTVNLDVSDSELKRIGMEGIENKDGTLRGPLALDLNYLHTIKSYFAKKKRRPTDIELETLAQTWSEHCKHTIFADPIDELQDGIFKTYIKGATDKIRTSKKGRDFCVSVFTDNSGAITFDENYLITDKVETHNSPSALDPFGGAVTGIVGVNRDTIGFGRGAKPIINKYGYCFADPRDKTMLYKDKHKKDKMLSSRRILEGVVEGVNAGGNQSGIPTPLGFMFFDKRYRGKPLVFVGTVGLIPKKIGKRLAHKKKAQPGDYIVMVGGRVGIDGIHGATFSSEGMETRSPTSAVQIGDPITQKKLSDAIVKEARDQGLYNSITDNGAGGLSSSVGEMARESGGCRVNLEKVPLKYPGLSPWQIWISESQERMTLAVPKTKWPTFKDLMRRRSVETTVIGKFTDSGACVVEYDGKVVLDLDMDFLHSGLPKRHLKTSYKMKVHKELPKISEQDLTKTVKEMLARLNITSFSFISQQYDHEVQVGSVLKPLQGKGLVNGDAAVTRPRLSSKRGIVLSYGINPTYSDIDTYHMAACAIDTAVRRAIAVGGTLDHLALLDNFCWGSSDQPEQLDKLKRAARACYDYAVAYGTPFISGKDSMFNDFRGYDELGEPVKITVPETLLISAIGVIRDSTQTVSLDTKLPGDLIYVLGETFEELGASEYFAMISEKVGKEYIGNKVPHVNAKKNEKLYRALTQCIDRGLIASSIASARGGLAMALSKMAIGGMLGIEVSLKNLPCEATSDDFLLFSESQGRVVVTIDPKNQEKFEKIMSGNKFACIGKVSKKRKIHITGKSGKTIVNLGVNDALKVYKETFKDY